MQTIDVRRQSRGGEALDDAALRGVVPRAALDVAGAIEVASTLIDEVRERGAAALVEHAERFDRVTPTHLRVDRVALGQALDALDRDVRAALEAMIARVRAASAAQVPAAALTDIAPGAVIEQRWRPVRRAGVYVPGGKAVYPSSVVMNVVPAQVAGVRQIALASPAQAEFGGLPHPTILAACALLDVDEVWAMGGAGAIGAFAYGVPDAGLAPVDVITGPGNVYVAAAKRCVGGLVGLDAEAGPTEIVVLADDSADARLVAFDLISQAEHDELASAVLITDSVAFADLVRDEVALQVPQTAATERVQASLSGPQSGIILCDTDDLARVADACATEHLELHTRDDERYLAEIDSAGAIFVGPYAPVSLGDYAAGSNHVLPTGGQARFRAGLGAATFLRSQQVIRYTRRGLEDAASIVTTLAHAEGLPAHADAVTVRF